ncbi:MAG: Cobalt-containing nitrile hydratase subunit beta [Conexibacter sp.]|nr:Cobalt-containing nitrile hydratase subunit beta [Conexibacter sp.]
MVVRNGPHDLGGAPGFGPIDPRPDAELYPEGWEGRCIGAIVATMAAGAYNVDEWRARMEELPAAAQFAMGYYRRWFYTLERNLVLHDVLREAEIDARAAALGEGAPPPPRRRDPELLAAIERLLREGAPLARELAVPPRFAVGARVRTRRILVERRGEQHTRMPGYVQDRRGVVERRYPAMTLPDASVRGEDRAEFLYAVSFAASDLWPDGAADVRVSADLFESYLIAEA